MSSNLGLGGVLTTIVYPAMVGGQMTLLSYGDLGKDMSVLFIGSTLVPPNKGIKDRICHLGPCGLDS
jgi:hypothetical protein